MLPFRVLSIHGNCESESLLLLALSRLFLFIHGQAIGGILCSSEHCSGLSAFVTEELHYRPFGVEQAFSSACARMWIERWFGPMRVGASPTTVLVVPLNMG
jgi:hypothetical protein